MFGKFNGVIRQIINLFYGTNLIFNHEKNHINVLNAIGRNAAKEL